MMLFRKFFESFINRNRSQRRNSTQYAARAKLQFEPLESRELLSADGCLAAQDLACSAESPACVATLATDDYVVNFTCDGEDQSLNVANVTLSDEAADEIGTSVDSNVGLTNDSLDSILQEVDSIELESLGEPQQSCELEQESHIDDIAENSLEEDSNYLSELDLIDISDGVVRDVVFYRNNDVEQEQVDLSDTTKRFIDLDDLEPTEGTSLTSSGGNQDIEVGTPTITAGSDELLEANGFNYSGGATSYFVIQVPDVPSGYQGFIEISGTATIGSDFGINQGSSPSSSPLTIMPGANGVTRIAVSGGSNLCIFPIADNVVETTETISIAFGLAQNSGGSSMGGSITATIIDAPNSSYDYVLSDVDYQVRDWWSTTRPDETNQNVEWNAQRFLEVYRDSGRESDFVDIDQTGLLDDYRREMFNGVNLAKWNCFEDRVFRVAAWNLLNGERNIAIQERAFRDFTQSPDLRVYGEDCTYVTSAIYANLLSRSVTIDDIGVASVTETYTFSVSYFCSIQQAFGDPNDCDVEPGTPYELTGSWTENATYQIAFTFDRVEINN